VTAPSETSLATGPGGGAPGAPGAPVASTGHGPGAPVASLAPVAPTGRAYAKFVLVLGALIAIGPLTIDTYLPAMPALAEDLGASQSQIQGTLTGILLGMGLGQLLIGPLADAVGRRRPLIAGLALHVVASVLCALAPTVELLTAGRVLQGLGNAAVSVVAMATVRDLFVGSAAAALLSRLMLVMGLAPVLAPSLGGLVLSLTSWRGVFLLLSGAGVLLMTLAALALRETLPVPARRPFRPRPVLRTYAALLRDRTFVGLVLVSGLSFATLFAYIGGSSFVLQEVYGLSVQQFGLAFGANSLGFLAGSQLNPVLLRRFAPRAIVRGGTVLSAAAALVLLAGAATGVGGLVTVLVPLWFILAGSAVVLPNTPALALSRHGEAAGTAAALLGASQFVIGGASAPLIGLMGSASAVPMAAVIGAAAVAAAVVAHATLGVRVVRSTGH
jgi:DHA1 family bicyclomycin/chloramphenicol resistance-like MFS transporter